jgi:hypothetical protein
MNTLPVLANFLYDRIGSWREGNPYCIAFCYASKKPSGYGKVPEFIIKGGSRDVDHEIERRAFPMLVFRTYWWHGISRKCNPTFENFEKYTVSGKSPYVRGIQPWQMNGCHFYRSYDVRYLNETWVSVRRIPRKWLREYDAIILSHIGT